MMTCFAPWRLIISQVILIMQREFFLLFLLWNVRGKKTYYHIHKRTSSNHLGIWAQICHCCHLQPNEHLRSQDINEAKRCSWVCLVCSLRTVSMCMSVSVSVDFNFRNKAGCCLTSRAASGVCRPLVALQFTSSSRTCEDRTARIRHQASCMYKLQALQSS